MPSFETSGEIIRVNNVVNVSDKFRKRDFVLKLPDAKYPQTVQFQVTGDRCDLVRPDMIGETIGVSFNLRGRFWTNQQGEEKCFNSLEVWKVDRVAGAVPEPEEAPNDIPF